jgi:hypothetical protein
MGWIERNWRSLLKAGGIIHSDTGRASVRKLSFPVQCVLFSDSAVTPKRISGITTCMLYKYWLRFEIVGGSGVSIW